MSETRKSSAGKQNQPRENDKFRVVLVAPDREVLTGLLQKYDLDVGHLAPRRESKEIDVEMYLTQAQVGRLRAENWQLEVHENLSEIGRERQKEVSKGDRFEGGKVPPKGLGKKTRQEG